MEFELIYRQRPPHYYILPFRYIMKDGYIPLIKYSNDIINSEDYIDASHIRLSPSQGRNIYKRLRIDGGGYFVITRFSRNDYGQRMSNFAGLLSYIITDLRSYQTINRYIGINNNPTLTRYIVDDITNDVLILGVIKQEKIRDINFTDSRPSYYTHTLNIKNSDLAMLVSEDGIMSTKYMKENYSLYMRTKMLKQIKEVESRGIQVIKVSHAYLQSFMKSRTHIETNSLSEYKRLEDKVINKVFSNLSFDNMIAKMSNGY